MQQVNSIKVYYTLLHTLTLNTNQLGLILAVTANKK